MKKTREEVLIAEEQKILDELISRMDKVMLGLDKQLTYAELQRKKAEGIADAYGLLVDANIEKIRIKDDKGKIKKSRDTLYQWRLELDYEDLDRDHEQGHERLLVGLHTYVKGKDLFIVSWKQDVCRHYILDDALVDFTGKVSDSRSARTYVTHFSMQLKRKVEMSFDKVTSVFHLFPVTKTEEKVLYDEFLRELASRRVEQEFRNIVFSIQKKQGEIIKLPFKQNLIVQGCAGSGKSMIMLHRLPILIYDNPKDVNKTNMYIITPSDTYIMMAEEMREDLEIEDLVMGTIDKYYLHVLSKYSYNLDDYANENIPCELSHEQEVSLYSERCVQEIKSYMAERISAVTVDRKEGNNLFGIFESASHTECYNEELLEEERKTQTIATANENVLFEYYYNAIQNILEKAKALVQMLRTRRISAERGIRQEITESEERKKTAEKELEQLSPLQFIAARNRKQIIEQAEQHIEERKNALRLLLADEYYDRLVTVAGKVEGYISEHMIGKRPIELQSQRKRPEDLLKEEEAFFETLYTLILIKDSFSDQWEKIKNEISELSDDSFQRGIFLAESTGAVDNAVSELMEINKPFLEFEYFLGLRKSILELRTLRKNLVYDTYRYVLRTHGLIKRENTPSAEVPLQSYILLQILSQFQGAPRNGWESLITIDEAQNITPSEYTLINKVNGNKVILNLFGDENQHIEGTKGISKWTEVPEFNKFAYRELEENYRNARQITLLCKKRFNINMKPINLDGKGVHKIAEENVETGIRDVFFRPKPAGLAAIILHSVEECDAFSKVFSDQSHRIYRPFHYAGRLSDNLWNLMSVAEVKGLEFNTVIAIYGRMTKNEQYIAFTRALDELYICEAEIPILVENVSGGSAVPIENANGKAEKKGKSETPLVFGQDVTRFFEENGCKVIDERAKTGMLWVIGSREEIGGLVNMAISKFQINGSYRKMKSEGMKTAWCTKTIK